MKKFLDIVFSPKILTVLSVLLLMACISSFSWELSWHNVIVYFSLSCALFVAFVVIVLLRLSPKYFLAYMTLFILAIWMTNLTMAIVMLIFIYIAWGTIFSIEILLYGYKVESAQRWFVDRYSVKSFKIEYRIFYPIMWLIYFFLEVVPNLMSIKSIMFFSPSKISTEIIDLLE